MSRGPWKNGAATADPAYYTRKQREWRAANRDRARATARARRRPVRELIQAFKQRPCADCGVQYPPYVMQFDHREPATKLFNVSAAPGRYTADQVLDEIAKCDVVCANCHAERTFGGE